MRGQQITRCNIITTGYDGPFIARWACQQESRRYLTTRAVRFLARGPVGAKPNTRKSAVFYPAFVSTSGAARGRGRGEAPPPLWVDVQTLCNMCLLSLSCNFFVSRQMPNPTNSLCTAVNASASGGLRTLDPL